MIPSLNRLPLRQSPSFFEVARRRYHKWFTCWYDFSPSTKSEAAASVLVSKRVSLLAVERNTLKRRMREVLTQASAPVGLKAVFVMKKAALDVPHSKLAEAVADTLEAISYEQTSH